MQELSTKDEIWIQKHFSSKESKKYISTGYKSLDNLIDGFYGGCLYVIGARPGTGKTTLVLNFLVNLKHKKQLIFTTEIEAKQFLEKLASRLFGIDHKEIRQNLDTVREPILGQIEKFKEYDIHIVDEYKPNTKDVRQIIETIKPDIVYFDYFQNVFINPFVSQRYQEYTRKTEEFFNMARDYNIPIVLTSQLKRAPEDRKDSRPEMADMKETGKLEESAHVAILLSKTSNGILVDVCKNRNGSVGEFELLGLWNINKLEDII